MLPPFPLSPPCLLHKLIGNIGAAAARKQTVAVCALVGSERHGQSVAAPARCERREGKAQSEPLACYGHKPEPLRAP